MVPLNEYFDVTKDNYRQITELKRRFPGLRVLLSVGGGADDLDKDKYLSLVGTLQNQISSKMKLINSLYSKLILINYNILLKISF